MPAVGQVSVAGARPDEYADPQEDSPMAGPNDVSCADMQPSRRASMPLAAQSEHTPQAARCPKCYIGSNTSSEYSLSRSSPLRFGDL